MTGVEKRRLLCAMLFHFVAAVSVIWSLFVLIDRAAEEVQKGVIAWPFWTKWKAHNRIILVQNAPEKVIAPPSPNFSITIHPNRIEPSSQVVANIECNVPPPRINNPVESSYIFDAPSCGPTAKSNTKLYMETISSTSSLIKSNSIEPSYKMVSCIDKIDNVSIGKTLCDALELKLALDMEYNKTCRSSNYPIGLNQTMIIK
ncbi:hypothetical protein QE152_g18125 [Popillia japonica]|uniref:Uncharacterized protein n=1 Tax=Popillia japonica TaxID=7064 RepID=A0AAW1L051_POPJA